MGVSHSSLTGQTGSQSRDELSEYMHHLTWVSSLRSFLMSFGHRGPKCPREQEVVLHKDRLWRIPK
ncbi:NADH-quinone oxidoreductase subunit D [Clarias magur]|uniref:NADH-quinone oxidoreductase subunit D n=1 Tax=Clarias magur TaxID=1594786 RepID=A0A8J4X0A4_CLAMG|nr:NADH-quinone oxidoreductase subunit D [Clarias magur]